MSTKYRRLLKQRPVEMITLHVLFLVVAALSAWLPYYFAQLAVLAAGIAP